MPNSRSYDCETELNRANDIMLPDHSTGARSKPFAQKSTPNFIGILKHSLCGETDDQRADEFEPTAMQKKRERTKQKLLEDLAEEVEIHVFLFFFFHNFLLLRFSTAGVSATGVTTGSSSTATTTTSADGFEVGNASGNKLDFEQQYSNHF